MKTVSMTGFAVRQGAFGTGTPGGQDWTWEIRSVNGKGFDLRLRLPELDGLEAAVRAMVARYAARGNVSLSLRFVRAEGADLPRLSAAGLAHALSAVAEAQAAAKARGIALGQPTAVDILSMRGVMEQAAAGLVDQEGLRHALLADLEPLLVDFAAVRAAEGAQIGAVIAQQIDKIAALVETAFETARARRPEAEAALLAALERVVAVASGTDPQRVAQELALLAVKADVTEEIDRLRAHVAAARGILASGGPVGRKLDFLTQEFVREANTLCSKSGSTALTAIGLDLKHVIDQMREQIQNLE